MLEVLATIAIAWFALWYVVVGIWVGTQMDSIWDRVLCFVLWPIALLNLDKDSLL